jgi:hypothetical protein
MESQVEAFEMYGTVIEQLRNKIGDTDLFKELEEMGVKALPQAFAINNMDINYLKEYLALYDQRTQLANDMAAESLADETAAETAAVYEEYAVKQDDLRPSDLIFYKGHMALYIGGGKIIHSNSRDGKVTVSTVDTEHIVGCASLYELLEKE